MTTKGATGSLVNKRTEQKKILKSFALYSLGIFLCWSAFVSLFNLQSSINVEDGLGTTTLATSYFISSIFSIFGVPIMMKKFGAKKCLILGDIVMLPYILSNLYPRYYTLLPAAIIMSCLQCAQWPSMSLYNVLYAKQYSTVSKRPKDVHIIAFSAYFFTAFQASQVFGNLLSYIVLYGFDQISHSGSHISENCTGVANSTCHEITAVDYTNCGINDCQNATIISDTIEQYKPVNPVSLYVLVGLTILLELVATFVHAFFMPSETDFTRMTQEYESANLLRESDDRTKTGSDEQIDGNEILTGGCEKSNSGLLLGAENTEALEIQESAENKSEDDGILSLAISAIKSFSKHVLQLKLALLVPLTLYNGFAMGFVFTELTRAFTSCMLGVQWVGICMACYGLTDAIFSWVVGKVGRKIGRLCTCFIAVLLELGNYFFCLLWLPESHLLLSILGRFLMFGVTDGIFQTIVNVTHVDYFPQAPGTAGAVWNMLITFGFSIGYALSIAFCVRTRIYFNISFLCIGTLGLVIAEVLHRKEDSKRDTAAEEDIVNTDKVVL